MKFHHFSGLRNLAVWAAFSGASLLCAQGAPMDLDLGQSPSSMNSGMQISGTPQRLGGARSTGSDFAYSPSNQVPYIGDYSLIDTLYKIGPGDLFQIVVEGTSFESQVNPEGNIVLNRIAVVHLEGLSLREAKKRILDNLQTAYKRQNCFVNLAQPKRMRIFVTGAVSLPGIYEVSGNNRVSDAINSAGGFSSNSQKGTVEVRIGNKTTTLHTGRFLLHGDLNANPYLTQGSVLHVPFVDLAKPWVTLRMESSLFTVQLDSGESALDLVLKSYSFRPPPVYAGILVEEKNGKAVLVSPSEAAQYKPRAGAHLEIVLSRQDVFVGGAVAAPGLQPYRSEQKVVEYISRAGLLTSSRVSNRISVIRANGKRETLSLRNSGLQPGDVVLVGQNAEQKFLLYTPILLSMVSLALVYLQISGSL
jgi:protein involved in polysaccharide export with SLBB domain